MKYHKYQYHKSQLETTETARSTSRYPELYFTSGLQSSSYLILSVITYISFNSRYYHPIMDHIYTLSLLSYLMRSLSPTDYGYSFIETCGSSDVHQTFVFCSAMRAITSHIHVVLAVFVGFIVCMVLVKNINSYTGSYRSLLTILFLCAITSDCVLDDGETYHPTAFPTTMPSPEPTPRPTIEPIDYDFWSIQTTGTTPFPCTTDRAYAAGVDSSGIVYVGKGAECYSDFVAYYDPLTDHFVDDGCEECSKQNLPVSQHYTQTGDILYNVERVAKITYLDLSTTGPEWESLVDSTTGDTIYFGLGGSCLASTPDGHYLISLGGQDFTWHQSHSAAVEIYDLINEAFIRTANDLPEVRMGFGCVVHPYDDCLYALGGYIVTVDEHGRYTDIGDLRGDYYKLLMDDVANVASYDWTTYSESSLLTLGNFNRLIAYDKYLIALGGGDINAGTAYIAAWDLSNGTPVLFASTIDMSGFEWANSAYALFGNLIYVFGDDLTQTSNWQIVTLSLPSSIDYDYWSIQTKGSTAFPCTTDYAYAAGADSSGVVYVGGGITCAHASEFISFYDPSDPTASFRYDHCSSSEDCTTWYRPAESQYYTQTGDILYAMDSVFINYLDLSIGEEWVRLLHSTTGNAVEFTRRSCCNCLASTPDGQYLISLVGKPSGPIGYVSDVEIYDLINDVFITANPLPEVRRGFGCVVHPYDESLYAMGGYIDEDPSGDYYKLLMDDVDNIASYEWTTYSEESVLAVDIFNRLIAYDKYLIALGGGFHNSGTSFIAAWDLSSGAPVLFASTLELSGFEWSNSAYALFGNLIYVFGHDLAQPTNWQIITLSLPTPEPTAMTLSPTIVTSIPTTSPISYPNCNYKQKYKTTFTEVGKTWTNWYDGKVKLGKNAFLDEYPWCGDASSLEFFYQFVYDESARTLTFYAQFCCGTNKQFGSDYRVTWVQSGYGSKSEYVPNQAWIDHSTPLYDYTCKYRKDYAVTLPDKVWPTWQNYCNKWIKKGRDAFLDEKPWCGYEDSLEFFYRFSYNSNAKELTFYGHFCCGKESGKSLQFGAAY
eukprot:363591_1